jgi:hypothetical protein
MHDSSLKIGNTVSFLKEDKFGYWFKIIRENEAYRPG